MNRASAAGPGRILYIAFYFPPTRASGVHRSLASANHLARRGWDVTVVTPQREFFEKSIRSYDPSLDSLVDPRVTVRRVDFTQHLWRHDIRQYGRFEAYFPEPARILRRWAAQRRFPEVYAPWVPAVVRHGQALHRREPFDVIMATGNPHASFWAAHKLGRALGRPYVLDYRDAWTLNVFTGRPAFPRRSRNWSWERRVVSAADRVIFVNDALRGRHAERYPDAADRMIVVRNGYEPAALAGLPAAAPVTGRPVRFGYLGTVTPNVPLEDFTEGWRLARKEPELADAQARFHGHLGFFPGSEQPVRDLLPLRDGIGVSYEGPVARDRIGEVYASLDVLLLILAGSEYVTSGKVYEYVATGRPIVSVHPPESAAREVLDGYPLWFPAAGMRPRDIAAALRQAARAAAAITPEQVAACRRHAARFTREAQLEPLDAALREVVGD